MTLSQKALDRINGMTKGQVQKQIQDIEDGLGNPAALDALNARMLKFAPPPATPFPKQAALDEAYAQIKSWSDTAKNLITEARQGNHTYHKSDGETVKPSRARKAPIVTGTKPVIVVNGKEYTSWRSIADEYKVRPELPRDGQNWRKPVMLAVPGGTVRIFDMTAEEYAKFFPIPKDSNWKYEEVKAE